MIIVFPLLAVLALALGAFFSGMETGLLSTSRIKIRHLANKGNRNAQRMIFFFNSPERFITTVVAGATISEIILAGITTAFLDGFNLRYESVLATALTLPFVLLLAEIFPKTYFRYYGEKTTIRFIGMLRFFYLILLPATKVMTYISTIVFKTKGVEKTQLSTREEFLLLLEESKREGVLKEESKFITGFFELGKKLTRDIMIPRMEMFAVEEETPVADFVRSFLADNRYTRIPVFRETIDNVIGFVNVYGLIRTENFLNRQLKEFIEPVKIVPEVKSIPQLLKEMRSEKQRVSMVIDEFGGISGMVSVEDIVEEIFGELQDIHEKEDADIEEVRSGTFLVDGSMEIEDVNSELSLNLPLNDELYRTVGGFLFWLTGRIPAKGEKINFQNYGFIVIEVVRNRIEEIMITLKK